MQLSLPIRLAELESWMGCGALCGGYRWICPGLAGHKLPFPATPSRLWSSRLILSRSRSISLDPAAALGRQRPGRTKLQCMDLSVVFMLAVSCAVCFGRGHGLCRHQQQLDARSVKELKKLLKTSGITPDADGHRTQRRAEVGAEAGGGGWHVSSPALPTQLYPQFLHLLHQTAFSCLATRQPSAPHACRLPMLWLTPASSP